MEIKVPIPKVYRPLDQQVNKTIITSVCDPGIHSQVDGSPTFFSTNEI